MAKLINAVVCQRALIDAPTSLVSYIDVLDGMNVPRFPFTVPTVVVASIWQREGESALNIKVQVTSPSNELVAEVQAGPLVYKDDHRRGRLHCRVPAFEAAEAGLYSFRLFLRDGGDWESVHTTTVDLALAKNGDVHLPSLTNAVNRKSKRKVAR